MHIHSRYFFGIFVAFAVAACGAAVSAAQRPQSSPSTQAVSQSATLTGCVEYGPRDSYILATMSVPAQPDLSNESALEHEELAGAEHSYEIKAAKGEQLSQLIGAKVRVDGTVSHVSSAAIPSNGRVGGRGQASTPTAVDQLNASSVQKLADRCDARLTMFAL